MLPTISLAGILSRYCTSLEVTIFNFTPSTISNPLSFSPSPSDYCLQPPDSATVPCDNSLVSSTAQLRCFSKAYAPWQNSDETCCTNAEADPLRTLHSRASTDLNQGKSESEFGVAHQTTPIVRVGTIRASPSNHAQLALHSCR